MKNFIASHKLKYKNVPKDSSGKLTAVSLAYWIMDDGSFNKAKGYLVLCTES